MNVTDVALARPVTRQRTAAALVGVYFAYAVFNLVAWLLWRDPGSDAVAWAILGASVAQPILFGVWAALASGSLWTRLPVVVPCLMLLFVSQAVEIPDSADVARSEFIATVIAECAIFTAGLLVFLIFRWLSGLRIALPQCHPAADNTRIRFSIKYLLGLLTIYAVLFGISRQLKFQHETSQPSFLGPNFFISVLIVGGITLSAAVVPTLMVPLFILYGRPSKRALLWAIAIWCAVYTGIVTYWRIAEGENISSMLIILASTQLGAVLIGTLTALPLRRVGFRLVNSGAVASLSP